MCYSCKSNNNFASFSAPGCNRTTPKMKRYLENDVSTYSNNDSRCVCCCPCMCCYAQTYDTYRAPQKAYSPETYWNTDCKTSENSYC